MENNSSQASTSTQAPPAGQVNLVSITSEHLLKSKAQIIERYKPVIEIIESLIRKKSQLKDSYANVVEMIANLRSDAVVSLPDLINYQNHLSKVEKHNNVQKEMTNKRQVKVEAGKRKQLEENEKAQQEEAEKKQSQTDNEKLALSCNQLIEAVRNALDQDTTAVSLGFESTFAHRMQNIFSPALNVLVWGNPAYEIFKPASTETTNLVRCKLMEQNCLSLDI